MIYPVTMYAGKCDNCGETYEESHIGYSAFVDGHSAKEHMDEDGWIADQGKHYCPDCWSFDDEDNFVLKPVNK